MTIKRWTGMLTATGVALALSATVGFACDDHKKTAQTADAKAAKAVPAAEVAGGEKGCCAKKAAEAKHAVAKGTAAPSAVAAVETKGCDKPCEGSAAADGAGCPKKAAPATAVVAQAKPEPAKESQPADPDGDH